MVTGRRSPVFFHAEHRHIPWLRECDPDPIVEIHPQTAGELGISDGEWVRIENDRGRIKRKAKLTPIVHPKVVSVPHGWWLPETDGKEPHLWGIMVKDLTRETADRVQVDFLPFPTDLCDLCARRTAAGEKPACVKHCMAGCMSYGEVSELAQLMETMPGSALFVPR